MTPLHIIKIGGNIIDDEMALENFLNLFAGISAPKILIHGGGKLATTLADKLGVKQELVEGRRITDTETLKITTMVYAGLINKNITAKLQAFGCNAIGLSGADANIICAIKREHATIDYGFVGDVNKNGINTDNIQLFIKNNLVPIFSAITHNGHGQLLNTNADTIATQLAIALSTFYQTKLLFCLDKKGVLLNIDNEASVIPLLKREHYQVLKNEGVINKGMIPKIDNAFEAKENGVSEVFICHATNINNLTISTQLVWK